MVVKSDPAAWIQCRSRCPSEDRAGLAHQLCYISVEEIKADAASKYSDPGGGALCLVHGIPSISALKIPTQWIIERLDYTVGDPGVLASVGDVGRFFVFVVGGLVAIIVGSFMIRGTMHLWDNDQDKDEI